MGLGSSQRRKWYRVLLRGNRKLTAIRWIGQVSVGEMVIVGKTHDNFDRVKADKGAEKSCRRRTRGSRRGVKRSRVGKTRLSVTSPRPEPRKSDRSSRRGSREQSWVYKISSKLYDVILREYKSGGDLDLSPVRSSYGTFKSQIDRVSSLSTAISYHRFYRQTIEESPWGCEPDACLGVRFIADLEHYLLGTNVSFQPDSEVDFSPSVGGVHLRASRWNKTQRFLCRDCGRLSPGNTCSAGCRSGAPRASGSRSGGQAGLRSGKSKARVRRCGCKVGSKCPH